MANPTLRWEHACADAAAERARIEVYKEGRRLRYQMQRSTVWCADWVGTLVDTFELRPLPGQGTEVRRTTQFEAAGRWRWAKRLGLWAGLRQAHAYASRNGRRLALASQAAQARGGEAAGILEKLR